VPLAQVIVDKGLLTEEIGQFRATCKAVESSSGHAANQLMLVIAAALGKPAPW
jgi:hypothetical protein